MRTIPAEVSLLGGFGGSENRDCRYADRDHARDPRGNGAGSAAAVRVHRRLRFPAGDHPRAARALGRRRLRDGPRAFHAVSVQPRDFGGRGGARGGDPGAGAFRCEGAGGATRRGDAAARLSERRERRGARTGRRRARHAPKFGETGKRGNGETDEG